MTNDKLHSPYPWFLLVGLLALTPVLNNIYPASFFPGVPSFAVELLSVFLGAGAAALGFLRLWDRSRQKEKASTLLRQVAEWRNPVPFEGEGEGTGAVTAGRFISRLARNADEDLREIGPDFSVESLERLPKLFPMLLGEVKKEEDARIRLGVVGTYLGETLCRHQGFLWNFRADPALRQFGYLCSVVQKEGKELDPYAWAADLLTGKRKMKDLLKEAT